MENQNTNKINIAQTDGYKKAYTDYFEKNMNSVGIQIAKSEVETQTEGLLLDSKLKKEEYRLRDNMARFSRETALANERDVYMRQQQRVKLRDFLPKISIFLFAISIFASFISCLMSISSISHLYTINELTEIMHSRYWISSGIMFLAQFVATVLSLVAYALKQYYKRSAAAATVLRFFICGISVFTNHSYLCTIISEYTTPGSGIVLGWFFAGLPDLFSLFLSNLATRMKYRTYDSDILLDEVPESSLVSMLIENITFKWTEKIKTKWYANMETRRKNREKINASLGYKTMNYIKTSKSNNRLNKGNMRVFKNSVSSNAAFCERYRETILKFGADEEINKNLLKIEDDRDWRRVRDYFCANGLLSCDGRGKPVKRSAKPA